MKVMLDTNILISAILFPGPVINATMADLFSRQDIYLSSYVVKELKDVVKRKFPTKCKTIDTFLLRLNYTLVYTPDDIDESLFAIQDMKDYPVLYTAMLENMDILITGDSDFNDLEIDRPEIMTLADYRDRYMQ